MDMWGDAMSSRSSRPLRRVWFQTLNLAASNTFCRTASGRMRLPVESAAPFQGSKHPSRAAESATPKRHFSPYVGCFGIQGCRTQGLGFRLQSTCVHRGFRASPPGRQYDRRNRKLREEGWLAGDFGIMLGND